MSTTPIGQVATLAHGYTMAEIESVTRKAAFNHFRGYYVFSYDELREMAWYGAIEHLYSVDRRPTFPELLYAGFNAIGKEYDDYNRHHGRAKNGEGPNFVKFWLPVRHQPGNDGFSDHLVEKMSLPTALGVLDPEQYQALATLAAFDNDGVRAADALGLSYASFRNRIDRARELVKAVWYDDETPPKPIPRGHNAPTCSSGHLRSEHGSKNNRGFWYCRKCNSATRHRRIAREGDRRHALKAEREAAAAVA